MAKKKKKETHEYIEWWTRWKSYWSNILSFLIVWSAVVDVIILNIRSVLIVSA